MTDLTLNIVEQNSSVTLNISDVSYVSGGQPSIPSKVEFTAIENQTEFIVTGATAIVFFTRNGIEIALNSRFISNGIVYYIPIENNNVTMKLNDRIIITYL